MKHNRITSTIVILSTFAVLQFCSKSRDSQEANSSRLYNDTMYVEANGGLRMRAAANTSAAKVVTIPNGSQVIVLEESGEEIQLSGKSGKWAKVKFVDKEGWVFGGFLSDKKAEAANEINLTPILNKVISYCSQCQDGPFTTFSLK